MLFNRTRALEYMKRCSLDALVASSPANITYFTDYYCWLDPIFKEYMSVPGGTSDLSMPGYAVFPLEGEPALLLPPLFTANASDSWVKDLRPFGASGLDLSLTSDDVPPGQQRIYDLLRSTPSFPSVTDVLANALEERGLSGGKIGLEMEGLSSGDRAELSAKLPKAALQDCSNLIRLIRMVKSETEIERLTRGTEIAEDAGNRVMAEARPGTSLAELYHDYRACLAEGDTDVDHFTIDLRGLGIVSEPDYKLQENDILFIDHGCIFRHYFTDTGTTLALCELPEPMRARHAAIHASVKAAVETARPGVKSSTVHAAMWEAVTSRGFTASDPHGHGLGLEVRDYPIVTADNGLTISDDCVDVPSDLPLETGMIINFEASMFMPGSGSVQVEVTTLITEDGCRLLIPQNREPFYVK